jgi:hypothetical protein
MATHLVGRFPRRTCLILLAGVLLCGQRAQGKLVGNLLVPDKLATARSAAITLAAQRLAVQQLDAGRYALNPNTAADLLATSNGREVLTFIVSCALPAALTVVADDGSEFFGELGLAQPWLNSPLTLEGERWVSACLFARTNNEGFPVPLSLRGLHPALALSAGEAAAYTVEQGAFYGDYFIQGGEQIACSGANESLAEIRLRECAGPSVGDPTRTKCGFTYAGTCGDFAQTFACRDQSKYGFYTACYNRAICQPRDQSATCPVNPGAPATQVITVFLQPPL